MASCNTFDSATKQKKSIRKEVEKVFSKLNAINYSDLEKYLSENYKDIEINDIKNRFSESCCKRFPLPFCRGCINSHAGFIHKIMSDGIIKEGDTVIDLGSGLGIDCLLLRKFIIGNKGKVIGVDLENAWNIVAQMYRDYLGYENVDFILGDARELPFDNNIADAVISNATLTLISEKEKVFFEIFRVLKDGGNCYIHDAILFGDNYELIEKMKNDTLYADWYFSKSIREAEYLEMLEKIGFKNIKIEIYNYVFLADEGRLRYGTIGRASEKNINKFLNKYHDKIISAGVYIYAEK